AALYLTRRGCTILERNWHAHPGEIDIIAQCPPSAKDNPTQQELAFIEIRTRHGRAGLAEESISRRKATNMALAAYAYMASQNIDPDATPWRIDLIAVSMSSSAVNSINWIKDAISEEMLDSQGNSRF